MRDMYLHSLNATEDDNADVNEGYMCTCSLSALPAPKLTGIVLAYKWTPGKCIDTPLKATSIIVPLALPVIIGVN